MSTTRRMFLAILSGALLFAADAPFACWPLLFLAPAPLTLAVRHGTRTQAWRLGALCGLTLAVPTLALLNFPLWSKFAFGAYYLLIWGLTGYGLWRIPRSLKGPTAWLGMAAFVALVDTLACFVLPIWGTAQSFTKVLSEAPLLAQPAALGGQTLLAFACALSGIKLAWLLAERSERARHARDWLLAAAAYLALSGTLWFAAAPDASQPSLRVAALGFRSRDVLILEEARPDLLFERHFRPMLDDARAHGAALILTPEYGAKLSPAGLAFFRERLSAYARANKVALGFSYIDRQEKRNRVGFMDPSGRLAPFYDKIHLVPTAEALVEPSTDRQIRLSDWNGWRLGGMICQDDNYLDPARRYREEGATLMLVPTNDWREVKDYHFENSRFRAIENRYAVIRAAKDGYTAVVSARGEVLARGDSEQTDRQVVVADITPLPAWSRALSVEPLAFPALLALFLGLLGWRSRRRS